MESFLTSFLKTNSASPITQLCISQYEVNQAFLEVAMNNNSIEESIIRNVVVTLTLAVICCKIYRIFVFSYIQCRSVISIVEYSTHSIVNSRK